MCRRRRRSEYPNLVRRHHDALASAAQGDAEPAIAGSDEPRRRLSVFRIMRARRRRRSHVDGDPAKCGDMSGNGLAERNGCVVAGQDDAVVGCHGKVVPYPKQFGGWLTGADTTFEQKPLSSVRLRTKEPKGGF